MTEAWALSGQVSGLVSVVIPTRDRAELLAEAVASVLGQEVAPLEVVVVDDGSTDDTESVVHELGRGAPPGVTLQYVRTEPRGAPAARNAGLAHSRGEFVLFLDSDDLLLPGKLERSMARFLAGDSDLDVVCTSALVEDVVRRPPSIDVDPSPATVAMHNLNTGMPLFRRSVLAAAGPWLASLGCNQEWEYHARVMRHVRRAEVILDPLCRFRTTSGSQISSTGRDFAWRLPHALEARRSVTRTVRAHGRRVREVEHLIGERCLQDAEHGLAILRPDLASDALRTWREVSGPHPSARQRARYRALAALSSVLSLCPTRCARAAVDGARTARRLLRTVGRLTRREARA